MPKNIILLSDGTGNSSGKLARTNVWRLYQALDLSAPDPAEPDKKEQIAYYDDGVGTSSFKPLALLGGITGWGLKRNVLDLYTFLCRHYKAGDQIYCFGFSRGAFTIRVLAGLINNQGLVQADTEGELRQLAAEAFRAYREQRYKSWLAWPFRFIRYILLWLWYKLLPGKHIYKALKTPEPQPLRPGVAGSESEKASKKPARQLSNPQPDAPPSSEKTKAPVPFEKIYDAKKKNIKPAWFFASQKLGYKASKDAPEKVEIEFLGLWDTVAAYGLPFNELTDALDFIFPLSFPDRKLGSIINRACHALALDDERHSFHPELWNENEEDYSNTEDYSIRPLGDRLTQVWFAGMHSNLGGGYADDGMAHVALHWMMDEVKEQAGNQTGLRFIPAERDRLEAAADVNGKIYDSRRGLGGAYRYLPRKLADLTQCDALNRSAVADASQQKPEASTQKDKSKWKNRAIKIHESVFTRIHNHVDGYAPIGLPENYQAFPSPLTKGSPKYEEQDDKTKKNRINRQERVWNLVWGKRWVYFITVILAVWLAALPFYPSTMYSWEGGFRFLLPVIKGLSTGLSTFLPDFVSPWLEAYQNHPGWFAVIVFLLIVFLKIGSWLQGEIFGGMRKIFIEQGSQQAPEVEEPTDIIYKLRTSKAYKGSLKFIKEQLIPWVILGIAVFSIIQGGLIVMDSLGLFSTPTVGTLKESLEKSTLSLEKSVSWASGVGIKKGKRYEITLTLQGEVWSDASIGANFEGFLKPQPKLWWAIPLRRKVSEPWFKPIARIGSTGRDDYPLNPSTGSTDTKLIAEITARRDGELFLFVNDALLPVGQSGQIFYHNNHGTATVDIKLLD